MRAVINFKIAGFGDIFSFILFFNNFQATFYKFTNLLELLNFFIYVR